MKNQDATHNLIQQKNQLRKEFLQKRLALSPNQIALQSQQINQNFLKNLLPQIFNLHDKKIFSIYCPSYNEVVLDQIVEYFITYKINFCYPKIIQKNAPLEFVLWQQNQALVSNKFYPNIKEPQSGKIVLPDILIIPLIAFDSNMVRLGMGGGFYDRTIEFLKSKKKIITVGLAFELQLSNQILPHQNTDQTLDFITLADDILMAKPVSL